MELFFSAADEAVNHPGAGTGVTPNWDYYWKQTEAAWDPDLRWDWGIPAGVYGLTWPDANGIWHPYVGPGANDSYPLPDCGAPPTGQTYDGIDLFAMLWRHEVQESDAHMMWGYGTNLVHSQDYDRDGIPDSMEPMYGPSLGGPFYPGVNDSDGDETYDGHEYMFFTQQNWSIGSADHQDWSAPGHQSDE